MKHCYEEFRGSVTSRDLLERVSKVVESYHAQGYTMTLRQLYYQLVAADTIPNQQKEYAKLSKLLSKARMGGLIDWEVIEDRVRVPKMAPQWRSVKDILDAAAQSYRLPRHVDQKNYVEVWVEKDALSGVLEPITREYHVRLMVNRGYSSISAMHDAAMRFIHYVPHGHILYLGDHDPSGLDMVRDIKERLARFGVRVKVHHIALTKEQIEVHQPPPNPAKLSDSRATGYIEKHGHSSWELDALQPDTLNTLLRNHIEKYIDMEKYEEMLLVEEEHRKAIREFAAKFED